MNLEKRPKRSRRLRWTWSSLRLGLAVVLLAALASAKLSGCAGRSPAEAQNREVRLTTDEGVKHAPRYSPDNSWIAYAAHGSNPGMFAIFVIPPAGGEPKRISPDSLSLVPMTWSADGDGIFCREADGPGLYHVGLDGTARLLDKGYELVRRMAISPDGKSELVTQFNEDNRDLALRKIGGGLEYLAETPAWEVDGVFGPGPGEVTAVSVPTYMAPVSTISTWSPETRAYSPLPLPEGKKFEPTWSPNGTLLAYGATTGAQSDIWIYDPHSTRATLMIGDPQDSGSPAWAPDGEALAFIRRTKTSHLFAGEPGRADRRQLTDGPGRDFGVMASPDGQWLAFLRMSPGGNQVRVTPALCVMPAGGGEVKELDLGAVTLPMAGGSMDWSRDSRQIAFNGSDGSAKMDIYRIGRDGEGLARVTVEPGEDLEPKWSPDGKFISYTHTGEGRLEVAIVPAHGGLPRVITPKGAKCEGSVWSPRSDRIAYWTYEADGRFEIWIAPIDAPENRKRLIESKTMIWPMYWTDDGAELVTVYRNGRDGTSRSQSPRYHADLRAVSVANGVSRVVGGMRYLPSGKDMLCEFAAGAEQYRKLFYPGGVILSDGEDRADLYLFRVRGALETRAASSMTQWMPWPSHIAWSGSF